jgi:hypothetical protein
MQVIARESTFVTTLWMDIIECLSDAGKMHLQRWVPII